MDEGKEGKGKAILFQLKYIFKKILKGGVGIGGMAHLTESLNANFGILV